jgi:hypothetical protein
MSEKPADMQQSWPDAKEQLPQEMVSMVEVMKLDLHASEQRMC